MAITVAVHAVGLGIVLSRWAKLHPLAPTRFWPITGLLIRLAWWLILIHLVEISVWGMFYFWRECLPDAESAFYFAGVTYTTIGYGDLVTERAMANARPGRGIDRHPHVRFVRRHFLRGGKQDLPVACGHRTKIKL